MVDSASGRVIKVIKRLNVFVEGSVARRRLFLWKIENYGGLECRHNEIALRAVKSLRDEICRFAAC